MTDVVAPLLQWLNANPQLAGVATFVISAAESIAIIGTLIPGSITMTAIGTLAGAGIIPLYETILWAILGAIVGDGISYWLGYYFKDRLRNLWPFKDNPGILERGEGFVHHYGVMSVFIGRFIGPVRAMVPLVAGMLGMRPLQFTIANILSAIGWAPAYMLPGILLGAASLELPPDIAMHVILVLFLIFLFTVLCIWFVYKLISLIHKQVDQMLTSFWQMLKRSRYFYITTVILKHHNPRQHYGQLTLAFYFLVASAALLALTCYVKSVGAVSITANDVIFHFFRGIRTEKIDGIMQCISLLGQKQVIVPVALALFGWLLWVKRTRAAFHVLGLVVLAAGSIFTLKHLFQSLRPWGILQSPETFSMPSGHTTLSATIYMGIACLLVSGRTKRRWLIYMPAVIIVALIGISRLYLGAHWLTDVLAGWLLSTALIIFVMLSYRRQAEQLLPIGKITLVCFAALLVSYGSYYFRHIDQLHHDYSLAPWPTTNMAMHHWWEKKSPTDHLQVSLFGFPSQRVNIEWLGKLTDIEKTLNNAGWTTPPARDWISTLHRMTDIKSSKYLPMISPQYLDQRPVLILTKLVADEKRMLVIRLWESNFTIDKAKTPLWVGTIGLVPRSYSWLFRKHGDEIDVEPMLLFPKKTSAWEWKVSMAPLKTKKQKAITQPLILIRNKKG